MIERNHLAEQLIRHEGLRTDLYKCPAGKWTIGVGRNLEDNGISTDEALEMLHRDILQARNDVASLLVRFEVSTELSEPRVDALANMAFNLGRARLAGFVRMFEALKDGDFAKAADEVLNSKYARQVGARAVELALQLDSGKYQSMEG